MNFLFPLLVSSLIWPFLSAWKAELATCLEQKVNMFWAKKWNIQHYKNETIFVEGNTLFDYEPNDRIISLSFNQLTQKLYYIITKFPHRIYTYDLDTRRAVYFEDRGVSFEEIAADPATGNTYFIANDSHIGLCDLKRKMCTNIIEHSIPKSTHRHNLFLHPKNGRMFWIENKPMGLVWMANMNGRQSQQIDRPYQAYSISLDAKDNLLYVAEEGGISQINLATMERREFAVFRASFVFYYDCKLLITQNVTDAKLKLYHSNAKMEEGLWHGGSKPLMVAEVDDEHTLFQLQDQCKGLKCPNFCVLGRSNGEPKMECRHSKMNTHFFNWHVIFLILGAGLIVLCLISSFCMTQKVCCCCCDRRRKREIKDEHKPSVDYSSSEPSDSE